MHGRVLFLLGDLLGANTPAPPATRSTAGFRNFLGPLADADKFTAGGLIRPDAPDPVALDEELRKLLTKLAKRIKRAGMDHAFWDASPPLEGNAPAGGERGAERWENPHLPAGYTYLLQLIGHDLVDSACSVMAEGARPGVVNVRSRPLALDTIYGSGPDELPLAYEFDRRHQVRQLIIPRIRLRVGPKRHEPSLSAAACPFRDVARGRISRADAADDGKNSDLLREALIADPRNDDNFVVSQLTVLWHLLHNHIVELFRPEQDTPPPLSSPMARAYRLFYCARLATTLIYRHIILQDVLPKILHPTVRDHYIGSVPDGERRKRLWIKPDVLMDNEVGIPLEFSHGAFRFGHAMVRDEYRVNGTDLTQLNIKHTSLTQPCKPIFNSKWLVDWANFFCIEGSKAPPNLSQRIGPNYAAALNSLQSKQASDGDFAGLANMELRTAGYAQLWSVPRLFEALKARQLGHLSLGLERPQPCLPDSLYDVWREPIRDWLRASPGTDHGLDEHAVQQIENDPPFPFFILFEAAHELRDGKPAKGVPTGGAHLGPLGSIIVAETICGVLTRHPIAFEATDTTLKARLAQCCSVLLGGASAEALADLGAIASMADLVSYLVRADAFGAERPGATSFCAAT